MVTPEPGQLALGQAPGLLLDLGHRLLPVHFSGDKGGNLAVAENLQPGTVTRIASPEQPGYLFNEAPGDVYKRQALSYRRRRFILWLNR